MGAGDRAHQFGSCPDIDDVFRVKIHRNSPLEAGPGNAQVLEPGPQEVVEHFIPAAFGTTDEDHVRRVQDIFRRFYEQGDIYKGEYEGCARLKRAMASERMIS